MLRKYNRLSTKYEFNRTKKLGQSYSGQFFHFFYLKPKNYSGPSKVGIVVSTRFSKSAAKRNRLKRVFREVIRNNFDKIEPGYWIVVYPKFGSGNRKYEEISSDFAKTIQKVLVAD
ncbi:MAG TPA: ribonuclease P protein component [Patescibacteria group bacterium]|nr:ribonuclease P protein component [Patescibacteria group bacterium]